MSTVVAATVRRRRSRHCRGAVGIHPASVLPRNHDVFRHRGGQSCAGNPSREDISKQTPYRTKKSSVAANLDGKSPRGHAQRAGLSEPRSQRRDDDSEDRGVAESWTHGWISFVWKRLRGSSRRWSPSHSLPLLSKSKKRASIARSADKGKQRSPDR